MSGTFSRVKVSVDKLNQSLQFFNGCFFEVI